MRDAYNFFDPDQAIEEYFGVLPHWRQEGAIYFVTFRTADSLPEEKVRLWKRERSFWLSRNPPPLSVVQREEYSRLFPARLHKWLDNGYGACVLARPELKRIVEDSLRFFNGVRYCLDEEIVMPNHGHVLVQPMTGWELYDITGSWKKYTARKINKILGTQGGFWQEESFDHLVRSAASLEAIRQYIRNNPKYWGLAGGAE